MKIITPSECLTRIELFNARMDRLRENNYTLPRLRTQDLNALVFDMRGLKWWASVGIFNKNKERAKAIIEEGKNNWKHANQLRDDHFYNNEKHFEPFHLEKRKKGSYVSRSVYQKQVEENRKLLADIQVLVNETFNEKSLDEFVKVSEKWIKHFTDQRNFRNTLRAVCHNMVLENPEKYPDFLVNKARENSKQIQS